MSEIVREKGKFVLIKVNKILYNIDLNEYQDDERRFCHFSISFPFLLLSFETDAFFFLVSSLIGTQFISHTSSFYQYLSLLFLEEIHWDIESAISIELHINKAIEEYTTDCNWEMRVVVGCDSCIGWWKTLLAIQRCYINHHKMRSKTFLFFYQWNKIEYNFPLLDCFSSEFPEYYKK